MEAPLYCKVFTIHIKLFGLGEGWGKGYSRSHASCDVYKEALKKQEITASGRILIKQ